MAIGTYRDGIDSLRAISVIAILVYHFFPALNNAGFLGVDSFFVISGFVITASFINYPTPVNFNTFLARFYIRRVRRLFPALLLVVVIFFLLSLLFISRGKTSLNTGAFSLIGLSNFYLYRKSLDYFGVTAELNLFTHLWSLGVEDQFYMLFPFAVWFFGNSSKPILNIGKLYRPVLLISTLSLGSYLAINFFDPSFAFYMMPTRLWEIGIGVLAFIFATNGRLKLKANILPVFLLLMIAVIAFGQFIGYFANIAIVVLTAFALVIIWQSDSYLPVFNSRFPSYLGKLSYSLYLWHWPIIVLAKHTFGTSIAATMVCILLTFGFSAFSFHFVENRFRRFPLSSDEMKLPPIFLKLLISSIIIFAVMFNASNQLPKGYNNILARFFEVPLVPPPTHYECFIRNGSEKISSALEDCLGKKRHDTPGKKLFLLGDSHANHIVPLVEKYANFSDRSFQFVNFQSGEYGVRSLIGNLGNIPPDFQYVMDDAMAGDILAISFHRGRLNSSRDKHLPLHITVEPNGGTNNFIANLSVILKDITNKGVHTVLLLDTPLMKSITTSETCALQVRITGNSVCKITKQQDKHTRWRQEYAFNKLKQEIPQIKIWDPLEVIYSKNDTFEVIDSDNKYLMRDWNHVTRTTLSNLEPSFFTLMSKFKSEQP